MTETNTVKKVTTKKRNLSADDARIEKLKSEPKVKVFGNPMFIASLGETYTFLYNGNPVSINFDETYQEYPETIAKLLEKKLASIARANTSRNINTKLS